MLKIAINGFGRIGRLLYRALIERQSPVKIVAIHDLCDVQLARHLLIHDSHYGLWSHEVKISNNNLLVADQVTHFLTGKSLTQLPWQKYQVDLLVEATGKIRHRDQLSIHLKQGARRVLLTTSSKDIDLTVIFGVNHHQIKAAHFILSAASCTSNCLIPLLHVLQTKYNVLWSNFITIHAHTNDQQILDLAHQDWYRSRSASQSIIPTSTNATAVAREFFPQMPLHGSCVRVPVTSVSALHLTSQLSADNTINLSHIKNLFCDQANGRLANIIKYTFEPLVSIDYKGCTASAVIDMPQLNYQSSTGHLSLTAWYDNEWGYVQRLVDIISYLQQCAS